MDVIKDLVLSIMMLELIERIEAISIFSKNFGSVIVLSMFASILIPLFISSLHLALNSLDMLWLFNISSKKMKFLMTVLFFILSPIHPLFLEINFLQTTEDAIYLSKSYDMEAIKKKHQCRQIKKQLATFLSIELGLEVYVQVTVQVLILLLYTTETGTTGGIENLFMDMLFSQKIFGIDPFTLFVLSIALSVFSCVKKHTKLIALEKGFCQMPTKILIFLWGSFATLRRILSFISMFIPGLGLFSILHHWRWEQIPFKARLEYSRRGFLTPDDRISLYGLNETIYWSELDRWDYSDPLQPTPPSTSIYLLMSLESICFAAAALTTLQFFSILAAKMLTSAEFKKRGHYVNKLIHVLENLNYATPFSDWDDGDHTIQEFRERFRATCKEMTATFCINIICTLVMLVPLWYTGPLSKV